MTKLDPSAATAGAPLHQPRAIRDLFPAHEGGGLGGVCVHMWGSGPEYLLTMWRVLSLIPGTADGKDPEGSDGRESGEPLPLRARSTDLAGFSIRQFRMFLRNLNGHYLHRF